MSNKPWYSDILGPPHGGLFYCPRCKGLGPKGEPCKNCEDAARLEAYLNQIEPAEGLSLEQWLQSGEQDPMLDQLLQRKNSVGGEPDPDDLSSTAWIEARVYKEFR